MYDCNVRNYIHLRQLLLVLSACAAVALGKRYNHHVLARS